MKILLGIILILLGIQIAESSIIIKCDEDTGNCKKFIIDDGIRHYERIEGKWGW